jgi:hypothetical protein
MVTVGVQLAIAGQALQRVRFPARVITVYPVNHLRLENEEAAIDPPAVT